MISAFPARDFVIFSDDQFTKAVGKSQWYCARRNDGLDLKLWVCVPDRKKGAILTIFKSRLCRPMEREPGEG